MEKIEKTIEEVHPLVHHIPTPEERVTYIESIKEQGEGYYLLNRETTVPKIDGNSHYENIKIWLSLGNVPELQYNDKELEENRIALIKAKAGEIINNRFPSFKQINASLGVYSKAETSTITSFIKDIRDQSTKLEKDPTKTADDFVVGE